VQIGRDCRARGKSPHLVEGSFVGFEERLAQSQMSVAKRGAAVMPLRLPMAALVA